MMTEFGQMGLRLPFLGQPIMGVNRSPVCERVSAIKN
jgi:hypothetical protein